MLNQRILAFGKYIDVKIYKHSSILYILSKLVKAINSDMELPIKSWIGKDNQTLEYEPIEFKIVATENGFDTLMTFKHHADWIN